MTNLLEVAAPPLHAALPATIAELMTRSMAYTRAHLDHEWITDSEDELLDHRGKAGTIVFIPDCDRLTYNKSQSLVDHAGREMARATAAYAPPDWRR